jgi:hypothetical protein
VEGVSAERAITAPHDVLFLKNELIESYTAMCDERLRDGGRDGRPAATYVSPRTKAACRDVLNASALLHQRSTVTAEDLAALRYVLTMVPGNDRSAPDPSQQIFTEALESTLASFSAADLRMVDELTTIAQTFTWFLHGVPLEAQSHHRGIIRLFLGLIGKSSWHDVSYDTFIEALRSKEIVNPRVNLLREEILDEIMEHVRGIR